MKRKIIVFVTVFAVCAIGLVCYGLVAQRKAAASPDQPTSTCSGQKFVTPSILSIGNNVFANYLTIAELQPQKRLQAFNRLSAKEKAVLIRMQFAFELVKRPNLTNAQTNFLVDAISKTTPEVLTEKLVRKTLREQAAGPELQLRAKSVFGANASEILGVDFGDAADISLINAYNKVLDFGLKERKRIVRELPFNDQINFWKVQSAYHLATASLNEMQRQKMAEYILGIPADFVAAKTLPPSEAQEYGERLEKSLFTVFSKSEVFAIFSTIGIQQIIPDAPELPADEAVNRSRGPNATAPEEGINCDCRWYCETGSCGTNLCTEVRNCGPADNWMCTGKCGPSLPD